MWATAVLASALVRLATVLNKVRGDGGAAQPTRAHARPRQMAHGSIVDFPAGLR